MRQIQVDVPRTSPGMPWVQCPRIQTLLEQVLYIWAIRHPGSEYVQGLNDLVTPFLLVFLYEKASKASAATAETRTDGPKARNWNYGSCYEEFVMSMSEEALREVWMAL